MVTKSKGLINYETYTLDNGLTVILHHDPARTVAAVNVLYKVGSRNDPPGRTGFAHLFEHLMFAGSENVPNFDDALQMAGGENNAVTGADHTLYYDILPAANLETALWLESDRMRKLRFSKKSLANEKKVVVEEFKETCLEEPYGDLYHHLNSLVYQVHPYRWPVIGERFEHIEEATLDDVKDFYYRYYRPDNAVLCIAGGFDPTTIREQVARWFGNIPPSSPDHPRPELPAEPEQREMRKKTVYADVPSPVIYLNYRTPGRLHPDFPAIDILCFLLGGGRSSLLYQRLARDGELFAEIATAHNDSLDSGAIFIDARPAEEVDYATARAALFATIDEMVEHGVTQQQLDKVVNRLEQHNLFKGLNVANRANELAFYASIGRPELANTELEQYLAVTVEDIHRVAKQYLRAEGLSEVEYLVEAE
ncbi:pitrilysin family protein [Neolewinella lacunae]|uniref:Insulinase family protein n=1 Tax=Neolewinella lacunae TaxID=1517758 RepID=A0A923PMG7_9BACT|nr:pitrilysin family protein [Neolewinella lacunae]MBC6996164.1 insulinase family protein [Neolewinella lacunae]MDN3634015.1 pitrilysin family protein [Neolewinella lacunae]